MAKQIPASELPLQADGAIYHLNLHPEELADNVVLVGDPGRVAMISGMFDNVEIPRPVFDSKLACGRVNIKERPAQERARDFDGVEIPLLDEEATQECGRCLRCDHFGMGAMRGGRPERW